MSRILIRAACAALLALCLIVLFASAELAAQRSYEGALYWLDGPESDTPGSIWIAAPVVAAMGLGESGTSFPDRVWDNTLSRVPPNTACFVGGTDPDSGPYGLQVVQYIGDWHRGTVYRPHAAALGSATESLFGYFDFGARLDRAAVSFNGLPEVALANPGACVAEALANSFGSVPGSAWESGLKDGPSGRDCLASSYYVVLRVNTELRCEPDISVRDAFTEDYWQLYERFVGYTTALRGPDYPMAFPTDYTAPYPSFRNFSLALYGGSLDGASASATGSLNALDTFALPASLDPADDFLPGLAAYRAQHPHSFVSSVNDPLIEARNPFRDTDQHGVPTADTLTLNDGRLGEQDCLEWNFGAPGQATAQPFACGRANSLLASTARLQAGGLRTLEVGPLSPALVTLASPTIGTVGPPLVPFDAPSDAFWSVWDSYSFRCIERGTYLIEAAGLQWALERQAFWRARAAALRSRLATLVQGTPEWVEAYADWRFAESHAWGWGTIWSYRQNRNERFFGVAQSSRAVSHLQDGAPIPRNPAGCEFLPSAGGLPRVDFDTPTVGARVAGLVDAHDFGMTAPDHGGVVTPEYWAPTNRLEHVAGAVTPEAQAAALLLGVADYPALVDTGASFSSSTHSLSVACRAHEIDLFAPDASALTPNLGGVFAAAEVLPSPRGTYRSYPKGDPTGAHVDTWARTSSGDVHGGVPVTWDAELIRRPADYVASAPVLEFDLGLTFDVAGGFPELDERVSGALSAWMRSLTTFTGRSPNAAIGLPAGTPIVAETEVVEIVGPIRFYGAMEATVPGGCTLRVSPDPGDMDLSAFVSSPGSVNQRLLCLVSTNAAPAGRLPGLLTLCPRRLRPPGGPRFRFCFLFA